MFYKDTSCANCGYKFNTIPETEHIISTSQSIVLCKKCAIPINTFYSQIERFGIKCSSVFDAMTSSSNITKCMICGNSASKNCYRKKKKIFLKLCSKCNSIPDTYYLEILNNITNKKQIRDFSVHTNKLNKMLEDIINNVPK